MPVCLRARIQKVEKRRTDSHVIRYGGVTLMYVETLQFFVEVVQKQWNYYMKNAHIYANISTGNI
jgi:hypothetical protein